MSVFLTGVTGLNEKGAPADDVGADEAARSADEKSLPPQYVPPLPPPVNDLTEITSAQIAAHMTEAAP